MNYTNKTQYIFRIRKNQLEDLNSSIGVNTLVEEEKKLPYKHMIYFGDGMTDIPCMKLLKSKGGNSVCVYNPESPKSYNTAKSIFKDGRVNFFAPADYSENSQLDQLVKKLLNIIADQNFITNKMKV